MSQSDAWDDWEQADEADIEAPSLPGTSSKASAVTPHAPQQPIRILQRPTSKPIAEQEDAEAKALLEKNNALWTKANAYQTPVIERADNTRTEYVPEISILRRPKGPSMVVAPRSPTVMKPLAEREAEYKAAREKIFGPTSSTSSPSSSSPSSRAPSPPIDGGSNANNSKARSQDDVNKPIHFSGMQPSFHMRPAHIMDTATRQPRGPPSPGPKHHGSGSSSFSRGRGGFAQGGRGNGGGDGVMPSTLSSSSSSPSSNWTGPGVPSPEAGGSRGFLRPLRGRPQQGSPSSKVP